MRAAVKRIPKRHRARSSGALAPSADIHVGGTFEITDCALGINGRYDIERLEATGYGLIILLNLRKK